ncbi:MAG: LacI family DNA-binding transcriptional regulator, partial [Actinomycetes bacterium]
MAENSGAKRPTIRDVAALAGVSKSLVSLVFSEPDKVGEPRRLRVVAAAEQLGYTPNFSARSLAAE